MADDVDEQVFNEKQLYTGDVVGEDEGDGRPHIPCTLPKNASRGDAVQVSSERGPTASSSSAVSSREKRKKRASIRATQIAYWLESKYDLVSEVCGSFPNWKEAPSIAYDFDLLWSDTSIAADRFVKLKPYQKLNHFVGMSSITRKNNLGRNLLRMRKQFPNEYRFFPDTWILPTDLSDFKLQFTAAKNKTYIIKPDNGCQGKGIFLVRDGDKVPVDFSATYVAQRYIHRPYLLDGYKFDLRLYVLVIGCDPLRIFLHKRGLVRLASEQYVEPDKKNLSAMTVHLTNYAINKLNPNFEENTDPDDAQDGHKRSWEAVFDYLRAQELDVDTMMSEIEDLIIKTLISVQPSLSHFYHSCQPDDVGNSMCFEILGFDVMLDHKLQPWLLEVNHAPSFAAESDLDRIVKEEVLQDTLELVHLDPETRRQHKREAREKMEQHAMGVAKKQSMLERSQEEHKVALERTAWEDEHLNGYKRLYPSTAKEREYKQIHDSAVSIWEMLMGGNSRRSVRLTQEPALAEEKQKEKENEKKDHAPGNVRERRSADEMREAVERLSAGCSARPRESCKSRRRGSQLDSGAAVSDAAASSLPPWHISASIPQGGEGVGTADDPSKVDSKAAMGGETKPQAQVQPLPRPEVQVGDVIKVQTNMGWENVTVRAKRNNGKIDIQFKDGEYMRSVLPRILRESVPDRSGEKSETGFEKAREKDAQPSSSSSSATGSAASNPKTARGGTGGVNGSLPASSTFKVPPLLPACSPIDQARGSSVSAAAVAAACFSQSAGGLGSPGKEAPSSPSASSTMTGASGVIAAAANAITGTLASIDLGSGMNTFASSAYAAAPMASPAQDAVSSFASNSQPQKYRGMRASSVAAGGEPSTRGTTAESGLLAPSLQQVQPNGGRGATSGLRPPAPQASGGLVPPFPSADGYRGHEVRLRNHLDHLISVRPIVTRRKGGAAEEAPKSPKSRQEAAARRHSSNSYGPQR